MKSTIKLPGISPAVSQILAHFVAVFLLAFGTQLVAATTGTVSISSLVALLTSAAAAGVVAVAHVILGLVPTQATKDSTGALFGITLKIKTALYQVVTSVVVTFVTVLGSELIAGAAHIANLPDAVAIVSAAIMAAVAGVVQYLAGLVPGPKT